MHGIPAHGGELVDLVVEADRARQIEAEARDWPSWNLSSRQLCDLELLLVGGLSPLRGFLTREGYEAVCESMRLPSGILWPIPVILDLPGGIAERLDVPSMLALRDPEGMMLAALH